MSFQSLLAVLDTLKLSRWRKCTMELRPPPCPLLVLFVICGLSIYSGLAVVNSSWTWYSLWVMSLPRMFVNTARRKGLDLKNWWRSSAGQVINWLSSAAFIVTCCNGYHTQNWETAHKYNNTVYMFCYQDITKFAYCVRLYILPVNIRELSHTKLEQHYSYVYKVLTYENIGETMDILQFLGFQKW